MDKTESEGSVDLIRTTSPESDGIKSTDFSPGIKSTGLGFNPEPVTAKDPEDKTIKSTALSAPHARGCRSPVEEGQLWGGPEGWEMRIGDCQER